MYDGHHYAHTHTINVNKTCALQQTTDKTGTKHRLCEIDINITHLIKFFLLYIRYGRDKTYTATHENINKTRFPFFSSQFYILDHTTKKGT